MLFCVSVFFPLNDSTIIFFHPIEHEIVQCSQNLNMNELVDLRRRYAWLTGGRGEGSRRRRCWVAVLAAGGVLAARRGRWRWRDRSRGVTELVEPERSNSISKLVCTDRVMALYSGSIIGITHDYKTGNSKFKQYTVSQTPVLP
jgi:hypothetical protein